MNKRIQKLAEQANAWYPNGYPSPEGGDEAWKNLVIFEKEDLEKFAESIVKECAKIPDSLSKLYPRTDVGFDVGYTMGTRRAAKRIKEHFEIKD